MSAFFDFFGISTPFFAHKAFNLGTVREEYEVIGRQKGGGGHRQLRETKRRQRRRDVTAERTVEKEEEEEREGTAGAGVGSTV